MILTKAITLCIFSFLVFAYVQTPVFVMAADWYDKRPKTGEYAPLPDTNATEIPIDFEDINSGNSAAVENDLSGNTQNTDAVDQAINSVQQSPNKVDSTVFESSGAGTISGIIMVLLIFIAIGIVYLVWRARQRPGNNKDLNN